MIQHRFGRITAIGVVLLAATVALSAWLVVRVRDAGTSRAVSSVLIKPREDAAQKTQKTRQLLTVAAPLAACEAQIERQPGRLPTVAIVGASYTAGEGPDNPELSWAVDLARQLRWNAVIYGVSGAGYVRPSASGRGPMTRMLSAEGLRGLHPALVIVQAGLDDLGVSPALEEQRVRTAVDQIRAAAPDARIALITTFAADSVTHSPALRRLDQAIIGAATATDPGAVIMDPLGSRWTFPRARDGLHPTAGGDAWLAGTVDAILRSHGMRPAPVTSTAPVICDDAVGAGLPTSQTA